MREVKGDKGGTIVLAAAAVAGAAVLCAAGPAAVAHAQATPQQQPQTPAAGQAPSTGAAGRQAPQQVPIAPQQPLQTTPQPSAPTPPTPLPKGKPDIARTGVQDKDVDPVTLFRGQTPGQRLPGDPDVIRTIDDALAVALRRSPSLLLGIENAVRTEKQVAQILAVRRPQVSAGLTYSRLANAQSSFGGAAGGASPGQLQNPFGVGLQFTPPGSVPVQLSGGSGSGGGAGTGSAGAVGAGTAGQGAAGAGSAQSTAGGIQGGVTRSANPAGASAGTAGGGGATRQQTPTDPTDPGEQPTDPTDPDDGNNGGGGGGLFGNNVSLDQVRANVGINQLIDITGIVRAAEQLGDLQKALTRLELARLRQQLVFDVRSAYFNVLRTQAFVRVNEAAVAQSEEQVRVTQAQVNAGVASQFDLLRARTQLENNRQALISARNQVAISRSAFANTLGVDPSTPVELADVTQVPPLPELDEPGLIATALTQRPEYLQADINILKSQKNTRLARRNLEPFLNAGINGQYNLTAPAFGNNRDTATFSLALTVPLYDGGQTREAVAAARSDERTALIQKDQFVRGIKAEVQQTVISVRDANERATVAASSVREARESLRLANVRYRAGVGTLLEVNDAQTALTQAETNQVNAQYDYLSALARLQRAVGQPQ